MNHPDSSRISAPGVERTGPVLRANRSTVLTALCVVFALSAPVNGQTTIYSPGDVGTVATDSVQGNTPTTANIFAWDINANSTASRDSYAGGGSSTLSISGSGGEQFRVILGSGVDLANPFWNTSQSWVGIISQSGNATLPSLTNGTVAAYTYNGSSYTLVNTAARGSFGLSGSATSGYSVNWSPVPEPRTALAGLLLAAGLLRRRRRA
jgi:hypothetical protein